MARFYLTGKSGFIGSRLIELLKLDVTDNLEEADIVIHLGAYGNHSWQKSISKIFHANVVNTFNLLEDCHILNESGMTKIKGFIFIGSSSEYGYKENSMRETDLPETKTMYGVTKVCGTYLTRFYSQFFDTVTIRPFSVYGEKENDRRFIPAMINCLNAGKPFTLMEGNHDWIYIDDFCRGVEKVIKNLKKLNGQVINIGTNQSASNAYIASIIQRISGKKFEKLDFAPARELESLVWQADNEKLLSLGWKQKVSLEEGLKKVYEFKTEDFINQQRLLSGTH